MKDMLKIPYLNELFTCTMYKNQLGLKHMVADPIWCFFGKIAAWFISSILLSYNASIFMLSHDKNYYKKTTDIFS